MINSIKRALKGEEKLWKVFWLWGVLLYVSSIIIGFFIFNSYPLNRTIVGHFVGWLGCILVFVYPFMFCWSLWICAKNTNNKWFRYFSRLYAIAFFPLIHIWAGWFIGMASMALISDDGSIPNN